MTDTRLIDGVSMKKEKLQSVEIKRGISSAHEDEEYWVICLNGDMQTPHVFCSKDYLLAWLKGRI